MRWTRCAYLDIDAKHPDLYGDCILLRDDDGMGFGLAMPLEWLIGKFVRITIEEAPEPAGKQRLWLTDWEQREEDR